MSENNKAPTEHSTRPLGNSQPQATPLARDISPHVHEHLKNFPDAKRRMHEHLAKKKTQSGHAAR